MPRTKNDTPTADAENGFAAFEAKVEEIQLDAVIEAELDVADEAVAAFPPLALVESTPADARAGGSVEAPAPPSPIFAAFGAWAQDAIQFQLDTVASLAAVRAPQDLLRVQIDFAQRLMALHASALARLASSRTRFDLGGHRPAI